MLRWSKPSHRKSTASTQSLATPVAGSILLALFVVMALATPAQAVAPTGVVAGVEVAFNNAGAATGSIAWTADTGQTLYAHITQNDGATVVKSVTTALTESPSGTYTYVWNGQNDGATDVVEGTYRAYLSTNTDPSVTADWSSVYTTVKVDNTIPTAVDNVPSTWQTADVSVTITGSDTLSGVGSCYYTTDGTTPTTGSTSIASGTPFTWTTEGTYALKYFCVDLADNAGSIVTATNTIRLDKTAPTALTSDVPSTWQTSDVAVALSATDATSGMGNCHYTTDGTTPTTGSTSVASGSTFTHTVEGTFTLKFLCVDVAGNAATAVTAANTIRLDKTAPTSLTNNVPASWQNSDVTVTLSATDATSGMGNCHYTTDGTTPTTGSTSLASGGSFTWTTEGTFTLKFLCVDVAGNAATTVTATNTIQLDKTVPEDAGAYANNDTWVTSTINLDVWNLATDALSGISKVHYTTDGSTPTTASPWVTAANQSISMPEGITTVKTIGVDVAGNAQAFGTRFFSVKQDTVAPVDAGSYASNATWVTNVVNLNVWGLATDATSGVAKVHYTTDGSTPTTESPWVTSANQSVVMPEGQTALKTIGVDEAGNVQAFTSRFFRIDQDTVAPTTLTDDVPAAWQTSDVSVTLSATDATSGMGNCHYTADGTTPTTESPSIASGTPFTWATEGTFTLKFLCVDLAGNPATPISATNTIRLDKTPPTWTMTVTTGNGNKPFKDEAYKFTLTITDPHSGWGSLIYKAWHESEAEPNDVNAWSPTIEAPSDPEFTITPSKVGVWNVRYKVSDEAGNTDHWNWENVTVGKVVQVRVGWNTLTFTNLTDTKVNITNVLSNLPAEVVWSYQGGQWLLYNPGNPAVTTLWEVNRTTPLMVKTTSNTTVELPYQAPPASGNVPIGKGWNMVSLPHLKNPEPVATVFSGKDINAVWVFNNTQQKWLLYNPNNPFSDMTLKADWTMPIVVYANEPEVVTW